MKNQKKASLSASLLAAAMFLFSGYCPAQNALEPGNPIVEMLDSLVSLNVVQKLQCGSTGNVAPSYQAYEVPTYSDDIYSKRIEKIQTPIPLVFNDQVKEYIDL